MANMNEYVVTLLNNYNSMKREIDALHFELKNLNHISLDELLEALAFPTGTSEAVCGGGKSDRTSSLAVSYQQTIDGMISDNIHEILLRLDSLQKTINRLDYYLSRLPAYQAAILRQYYIEGYSWRELQDLRGVAAKTLMRQRDVGIENLASEYERINRVGLLTL